MSLGLGVVQKDFIIVSSDTAVTSFPLDEERYVKTGKFIRTGEMIPTDIKSKKTHVISDKVILITTGDSILTDIFEETMLSITPKGADLTVCRSTANNIMYRLRSLNNIQDLKQLLSEPYDEDTLRFMLHILSNIDDPIYFSGYLLGFNGDGSSGMVDIIEDNYMKPNEKGGYPIVISGPDPDFSTDSSRFSKYQRALSLPKKDRTIENFLNAMLLVHAHISWVNKINVSPDCNFIILVKEGDTFKCLETVVDTEQYHKNFTSEKELY